MNKMDDVDKDGCDAAEPAATWKHFLQDAHPGKTVNFTPHQIHFIFIRGRANAELDLPWIRRFCPSEDCETEQNFSAVSISLADFPPPVKHGLNDFVLTYRCNNCNKHMVSVAVRLVLTSGEGKNVWIKAEATKIGEFPAFGQTIPPQAITLVRPARDFLVAARNCEARGYGIAAMAYYRRVLEDGLDELLDLIIKVAEREGQDGAALAVLRQAKNARTVDEVTKITAEAFPPKLLIAGENPIKALYSFCSHDLHNESDETCCRNAEQIRELLFHFAELVDLALKERSGLMAAYQSVRKKVQANKGQDKGA